LRDRKRAALNIDSINKIIRIKNMGSGSNMGDMLESTYGYGYFTMSTLPKHESGSQWIGR